MDQRELIRRLCNGALAQILHDNNSNNTANSSSSNMSNNNDSILNTLLINTIGNLILKRKTNKSTQTDFNVQRIDKGSKSNSTSSKSRHVEKLRILIKMSIPF